MRRVFIGLGVVLILGFVIIQVATRIPAVQDQLFARGISSRLNQGSVLVDEDALYVVFCGTGSPLNDPERASACTAIMAGGHLFMVDAGPGAADRAGRFRLPLGQLEGIFLTHFHSDHIGDIGEMVMQSWAAGREEPMKLYGPNGVKYIAGGFARAYALDASYRINHHGLEVMPQTGARIEPISFRPKVDGSGTLLFEADGLKITAFPVDHTPIYPAVGYRFDYKGRSVFISGDTIYQQSLAETGAKDVDVLIHEALAPHMVGPLRDALKEASAERVAKLLDDTLDYHTSPVEAARLANESNAKLLVYTHIVPPINNSVTKRMFLSGVKAERSKGVSIAHDGLYLVLPADGKAIQERSLVE